MKKDGLFKSIMLATGFVAMLAILGSQSFYNQGLTTAKIKAQSEQSSEKATIIQAPADAIPGHSVQVDDSSAFHFIADLFESEEEPELPPVPAERVAHFFELLFRTLIAPNAP